MIAFDATPLQSEHRFRGVGTYTMELALRLAERYPDQVCFIGTRPDQHLLPTLVRDRAILGRRFHRPAQVYWLYNEWFLPRMIRRVKPSLFHATDFNGTVRVPGIPTIATLYDLTGLVRAPGPMSLSERLSAWRWQVYYHDKIPRADHLIAISSQVRDDAMNVLGLPPERISVIPLGIDLNRYAPIRNTGRFAASPPYVLYVGSRDPHKNVTGALDTFATVTRTIPHLRLYLAGRWNPADLAWLQETTNARRELRGRVEHVGFVADDDMPSLYANAEVFLFPSFAEGFGLPILEAMACHTPVVASNRGSLPEVAGNAALLRDPDDVHGLAEAVTLVIQDKALREDLIQRGAARVLEFSWDRVLEKTVEVYRMLDPSAI